MAHEQASGTLYFFCGKMGAGKTTRSKLVANEENAVLISEDVWLANLYPDEIRSFDDYLRYSLRLKPLIASHVADLLKAGCNVVLDFPANTTKQRKWFSELVSSANATGRLIYIKVSDELCLERIAKRRVEQPERSVFDTPSVFNEVTKFFQEPNLEELEGIEGIEGLEIQILEQDR